MMLRLVILLFIFPVSLLSEPPRLLIFTGSDWCPNCRRFDKKILNDSAFISYAKECLVIEFADFPQHKKLDGKTIEKNKALAEKYKFQGIYPTILVLDPEGNKLGQILYGNQAPVEFINELKEIIRK